MGTVNNFVQDKRNELRGDNFYIKEGVMVFENLFIPLDSISVVELNQDPLINIGILIIYCVLGFVGLFVPLAAIRILGLLILGFGISFIYLARKKNNERKYILNFRLHNGQSYVFKNDDLKFVREIMSVIEMCIDGRKGNYTINMIKKETLEGCNITNIGDIVNSMNNMNNSMNDSMNNSSIINSGNKKTTKTNSVSISGITEQDWNQLKGFLVQRQNKFEPGSKNYEHCENLIILAENKKTKGFKEYMQSMGKAAFGQIFVEAVKEGAKYIIPIITTILK